MVGVKKEAPAPPSTPQRVPGLHFQPAPQQAQQGLQSREGQGSIEAPQQMFPELRKGCEARAVEVEAPAAACPVEGFGVAL